tara:strand:+ start:20720 stop:21568 length:849 start_codon:yes stop_codon:yes gene_type:complete
MKILLRKIKNIIPTFKEHGFDGLYYAILRLLGSKVLFVNYIDKRRNMLAKRIEKISDRTVMWGPYKGLKLLSYSHWFREDAPMRLIGTYELEVQEKLVDITKDKKFETFVNFGAADGYHLLSILKKGYVNRAIAFEKDPNGRKLLRKTAELNGVSDNLEIYDAANMDYFYENSKNLNFAKILFLIDIEGDEFSVLDDRALKLLSESTLLIENHDFLFKNKELIKAYFENIDKYFKLEKVKYGARNPHQINEISHMREDDRWLMMGEGRPSDMVWLYLTPKNI